MSLLSLWTAHWAEPALLITWLLTLFALLALLCERGLRLRSARVRHTLWWFVLLAPLVIAPVRMGLTQAKALVAVPMPAAAVRMVPTLSSAPMGATSPALPAAPSPAPPSLPWRHTLRLTDFLALLWTLGFAVLVTRLLISHQRANRVLRASTPIADAELCADFAALCTGAGLRHPASLHHSDAVGAPALYGWRRPVVLLPATLLEALDGEQLRAVLAHEVAHLRRRDFAANLLQRLLEATLFFHPAVWLASRKLTLAREELCDAWVLGRGLSATTYARSLAEAVEHAHLRPALALLSLAEEKSSLRRRVEAIMGGERGRLSRRMVVALVAVGLGVAAAVAVVEVRSASAPTPNTVTLHPVAKPMNEREVDAALEGVGIKTYRLEYELPFEHLVKVDVEYYEHGQLQNGDLGGFNGGAMAGQQTLMLLAHEEKQKLDLSFRLFTDFGNTGSGTRGPIPLDGYQGARYWGGIPVHEVTLGQKTPFWCLSADRAGKNASKTPSSAADLEEFIAAHDLAVVAYVTIVRRNTQVAELPVRVASLSNNDPSLSPLERIMTEGASGVTRLSYFTPFRHRVSVEVARYEHGVLTRDDLPQSTEGVEWGSHAVLFITRPFAPSHQNRFTYAVRPEVQQLQVVGEYEWAGFRFHSTAIPLKALVPGKKTAFWTLRGYDSHAASAPLPAQSEADVAYTAYVTITPM